MGGGFSQRSRLPRIPPYMVSHFAASEGHASPIRNDEGSPFPPPPCARTQPSSPIRAQKIRWIQSIGFMPTRRMSAAALSAAVDSTTQQETAPTFRRNQESRNVPTQTPAALREGARGRRLLSEKPPPLQFPLRVRVGFSFLLARPCVLGAFFLMVGDGHGG